MKILTLVGDVCFVALLCVLAVGMNLGFIAAAAWVVKWVFGL